MKSKLIALKRAIFSWRTAFIAILLGLLVLVGYGLYDQVKTKTVIVVDRKTAARYAAIDKVLNDKQQALEKDAITSLKTSSETK